MADIATKNDNAVFGISAQYVIDGKIVIYCLGMRSPQRNHKGMYLYEVLVEHLKEYNVDMSRVIFITVENGRNILKMSKIYHAQLTTYPESNVDVVNVVDVILYREDLLECCQNDKSSPHEMTARATKDNPVTNKFDFLTENDIRKIIDDANLK